jgi:8-oxo-dGTP pyrophosphatase MutT (NUDIX family)
VRYLIKVIEDSTMEKLMSKKYFKVIPAVYLVLRNQDRVLLLRRANTGYQDGMYSLPAGHVDGNETLEYAMSREAFEEIGITINPKDLQLVHVQHRRASEPDISNERVDFYFECSDWISNPENKEPNKCDDLSWRSVNKLPENVIPHVATALECIEKRQISSSVGW